MKEIKTIELAGSEYPMTCSFGALEKLTSAFGGMDKMQDALSDDDIGKKLVAVNTVLEILIDDGIRYAKLIGQDAPASLDFRPIDVIDMHDMAKLNVIYDVLRDDNKREIEARPPKNAKPTPEE